MAKFFQNYTQYLRVVNIQKEMDSKIYVVLIIIWLMYLSRGKIIFFEKYHNFVILPNEDSEPFLKSGTKIKHNVKNAKKNRLPKKRKYIVDIVAAVLIFLFCLFNTFTIFKSNRQRCSIKQAVYRNSAMFTSKHLQALRSVTLLKKTPEQVFSCGFCKNFAKSLRTLTLKNICKRLLLYFVEKKYKLCCVTLLLNQ